MLKKASEWQKPYKPDFHLTLMTIHEENISKMPDFDVGFRKRKTMHMLVSNVKTRQK